MVAVVGMEEEAPSSVTIPMFPQPYNLLSHHSHYRLHLRTSATTSTQHSWHFITQPPSAISIQKHFPGRPSIAGVCPAVRGTFMICTCVVPAVYLVHEVADPSKLPTNSALPGNKVLLQKDS